jgi:hypothetical protein
MNVSDENAASFFRIEACRLKIGEIYHVTQRDGVKKGTFSEPMGRNGQKIRRR